MLINISTSKIRGFHCPHRPVNICRLSVFFSLVRCFSQRWWRWSRLPWLWFAFSDTEGERASFTSLMVIISAMMRFKSFAPFQRWVALLSLLQKIRPVIRYTTFTFPLHSLPLLAISYDCVQWCTQIWILMKYDFPCLGTCCVVSKKPVPGQRSQRFTPTLLSESFGGVALRASSSLELMSAYGGSCHIWAFRGGWPGFRVICCQVCCLHWIILTPCWIWNGHQY